METLQSFILGIIQGITEFLPISSTAHLILFPWLFNFEDKGLPFNIALHFGSLFAIIFYFKADLKEIIKGFSESLISGSFTQSEQGKLGLYLIIATIPAVIAAVLFENYVSGILRNPIYIAFFLFIFAILLYVSEKSTKREKSISEMGIIDCLFFGFSQAFAIIPGVSRSGVTITGGLFRNYKRDEAAKFSFLLGIPLIIGAAIFELRHLKFESLTSLSFVVGVLTSFISAFLVIKFFLKYLKTKSFTPFVVYRILLSILIVFVDLYFKS